MPKIERTPPKRKRVLPTLAILPASVTQDSAPLVLGIAGRRFREIVARRKIRHARDGQLVIVLLSDWLTAMDAAAVESDHGDEPQVDPVATADDMLAELGRRRAGGAR